MRGSLDDGGLHVRGAARQPGLTAALSSQRGGLPALKFAKTALSDTGGVTDLGPERNTFPLHVADGATVSLSGAGVGSLPVAFRYRLAAALSGAVLSGNAAPGARILVEQSQGARSDRQTTTASGGGAFAVTLHDPAPGDEIVVSAADPATRGVTTRALIVGGLAPSDPDARRSAARAQRRDGVRRGRARGRERALGRRHPGGARRNPVRPSAGRVPDGPARITATAQSGPSATDYLYVIVDSTPPAGGAGPDQTRPWDAAPSS